MKDVSVVSSLVFRSSSPLFTRRLPAETRNVSSCKSSPVLSKDLRPIIVALEFDVFIFLNAFYTGGGFLSFNSSTSADLFVELLLGTVRTSSPLSFVHTRFAFEPESWTIKQASHIFVSLNHSVKAFDTSQLNVV